MTSRADEIFILWVQESFEKSGSFDGAVHHWRHFGLLVSEASTALLKMPGTGTVYCPDGTIEMNCPLP
jgi:hypothetical protein